MSSFSTELVINFDISLGLSVGLTTSSSITIGSAFSLTLLKKGSFGATFFVGYSYTNV